MVCLSSADSDKSSIQEKVHHLSRGGSTYPGINSRSIRPSVIGKMDQDPVILGQIDWESISRGAVSIVRHWFICSKSSADQLRTGLSNTNTELLMTTEYIMCKTAGNRFTVPQSTTHTVCQQCDGQIQGSGRLLYYQVNFHSTWS